MLKVYKVFSTRTKRVIISSTTSKYLSSVLSKLRYKFNKNILTDPSLLEIFTPNPKKVRITLIREVENETEAENIMNEIASKHKYYIKQETSHLKYGVERKNNEKEYNRIRYETLKKERQLNNV